MYLHLGADVVVRGGDIVGIFDLDHIGVARDGLGFLRAAERAGRVETVGSDLPKAAVVCAERVYLTQVASATLLKRAEAPGL
ncbi:MAG: DUF370 domain-containing protein [Oscillospiraceae bacterium]|nr:DUF370 domain-containing protein [Oscillospiraceae bacterium]